MNEKRKNQANGGQKIAVASDVILEAMVDSVGVTDLQGRIIQANKAHADMFGYGSVDELIGKSPTDLVPKSEIPRVMDIIKESMKREVLRNFESIGVRKDGTEFPIQINIATLKDQAGKPVGSIAVLRDITELKKVQEQAQKAVASEAAAKEAEAGRKKLEIYLESMIDGVGVTDMRGNLVKGNTAVAKMHGYDSIEEMIGKNVSTFTKKTDIPKLLLALRQCWEKGVLRDCELTHVTKQGKEFPVSLNATALKDEKGEIVGTVAVIRDITERKLTEKMLWESQERYRAIMDNAVLGITIMDTNHKIIMTNATFAKLFNKSPGDFVGKYCFSEYEHREAICSHCPGVPAMASGKTVEVETYSVMEDGSRVDVRNRAIPLFGSDGVVKGFIEVVENISERKKAEQTQAHLLAQVEQANQELKDFAYVVSHDLKAPLRGIKTLANWISTDYADKLDEDGKEQVNLLVSRVDRMHNLIDGILQYSRIGRVKEEKAQVNLNELLPDIIDMIAPPENISITIENELPVIECEQTRITQVFQNLLSNAVKYMDNPQGQIRIGCVEENGFWKLSVADNGPGIEERYFEKIFQMFQTLSPRDEFESTGVGLTGVKKIVEMYGGRIWVESKMGEGSTFFFTLPKQKDSRKAGSQRGGKNAELQASIVSRR